MDKIDVILQGKCDDYTIEIANHYLKLDFINKIIVSCWENDNFSSNNKKILIIKSQDLSNPGVGNRNRQIKTSLEGLKLSSTFFSAKLRSDQKIALDSMQIMYNFYQKYKEQKISFSDGSKPNNQICVAGIFKLYPFHPRDHIFWGNTQDLIDVFNIPYDDISLNSDYTKYVRSEAYIASKYYSKFDNKILQYVNAPEKYLVDNAPNINEALESSAFWEAKIFKPFPRINFEWPKYNLKNYHYEITSSVFGEYWND